MRKLDIAIAMRAQRLTNLPRARRLPDGWMTHRYGPGGRKFFGFGATLESALVDLQAKVEKALAQGARP